MISHCKYIFFENDNFPVSKSSDFISLSNYLISAMKFDLPDFIIKYKHWYMIIKNNAIIS